MYPVAHHVPVMHPSPRAAHPSRVAHPTMGGYPEAVAGRPYSLRGIAGVGLGDGAACMAAAQALALEPTPNASGYTSDPTVLAFQQAWNGAGGQPQLPLDGLFGGCTFAALVATGLAPSSQPTVPNQSDGGFECTMTGATFIPPQGCGGTAPPVTCPPGQVWDIDNNVCIPIPAPAPSPQPAPGAPGGGGSSTASATATSSVPMALIAVLGIAAVGGVAYAMSRGGAAPSAAPAKKLPARRPARHATHLRARRAHEAMENPAYASEEWYRFEAPGQWRRYHGRPQGLRRMSQPVQFRGQLCPVYSSRSGIFLRGPDEARENPLTTGQTAALAVGGVVAVGGLAYLLTRSPAAAASGSGTAPKPDANGWTPVAQSAVPAAAIAALQSYTTSGQPAWQAWADGPQLPPAGVTNVVGPAPSMPGTTPGTTVGPYYAMAVTGTTTQFYSHP